MLPCDSAVWWRSLLFAVGLCACSQAPEDIEDRSNLPQPVSSTSWFTLHGQPGEAASLVKARLQFGGAWLDEKAGLKHSGPGLNVFLYLDRTEWEALLSSINGRPDGFSFFRRGELHLLYPLNEKNGQTYISVFHELTHDRFYRADWKRLPLWLEEGSAQALGWRIAKAFAKERDMRLERKSSGEARPFLLPLKTLESLKRYPDDPEKIRSFYYQSEWIADYLLKRMPLEDYIAFLEQTNASGSGSWRQVLKRRHGWSDGDLQRLEHLVAPMGVLN